MTGTEFFFGNHICLSL